MTFKKKGMFLLLAAIFSLSTISCDEGNTPDFVQLSDEERSDLIYLREEEKLARDVYIYAFEKYGLMISQNISQSEQRHMDAVLARLDFYNIADPASREIGVFNNEGLQNLYSELITKVDSSIIDALIVGAIIEDLDIDDLNNFIARTDKADIISVFNSLRCGSKNHLRSYMKEIKKEGGTYSPKYLSQEDFDEIINSSNMPCG